MDYETRKQLKIEEEAQRERSKSMKTLTKAAITVVIVIAVGLGLWRIWPSSSELQANGSEIIAKSGLHWHVNLSIIIKGEKQEIPANIGIGAIHQPIHTHETDGVIHLEFSGPVREKDIVMGKFLNTGIKNSVGNVSLSIVMVKMVG